MNGDHAEKQALRKPTDPARGHYIKHPNGQRSHYYLDDYTSPCLAASEKQYILIQHGCAHTAEFFYHWVPRLCRDYVVIRRDARGHGKSSYPKRITPWDDQRTNDFEGGYAYDDVTIVDEILDFLNQLNINRIHFFGEATSGEIGEIFAARYPERIASLITCSSPTMLPQQAIDLFCVGERSWPEAVMKLGARGWGEAMSRRPGTIPIHQGEDYLQWWLEEAGKTPREGLAGYVIFLTNLTSRPYLKQIKCPMLILAPTNSAAVPMAESEWVHSQVVQSRLVRIDGPGHEIFVENAEACIDATLEFLAEVRGRSAVQVEQASPRDVIDVTVVF